MYRLSDVIKSEFCGDGRLAITLSNHATIHVQERNLHLFFSPAGRNRVLIDAHMRYLAREDERRRLEEAGRMEAKENNLFRS